jgi:hypothetical protein
MFFVTSEPKKPVLRIQDGFLSRILIFPTFRIPDLGSRIPDLKEEVENFCFVLLFYSHKFHKI